MSNFVHGDFMLSNEVSKTLYHECAENLPIIDYHCHLVPQQIAENIQFRDICQLWLVDGHSGDHYKWRALRGNGVSEDYITGDRSPWEKFEKWAETVPYTMRNPLYHWTHLELSRVFGIEKCLNPKTAREIYEECNEKLSTEEFRGQALIRKFNVETLCTTDDPADDLRWHKMISEHPFGTKVLPTWRPDKAMAVENPETFIVYIQKLGESAGLEINSYHALQEALQKRHDFFAAAGCRLSDHGMDTFYAENYTDSEIERIFSKLLKGQTLGPGEAAKYKSAFLFDQGLMDAASAWAQQYHVGVIRNNNTKMFRAIGPDTGYDSIHDVRLAEAGLKFFDRLTLADGLAKTILYCLNPKDNELLMTLAYNFNDGSFPGKMQLGAAWWFLDQEDGMRRQLNAYSSLGLLSRFVGMLTDSRSFISYPRHEYFRRILCDLIGDDLTKGKLPVSEMDRIRQMVSDISYFNAKDYFGF